MCNNCTTNVDNKTLCKKCYRKEYYQKNKEKIKTKSKKYHNANKEHIKDNKKKYYSNNIEYFKTQSLKWREQNKDAKQLRDKKYREENQEAFKERDRIYYLNNKDKHSEGQKLWRKKNRKLCTAYNAEHRAKKLKATPGWADLKAIKEFYLNCPEGYEVDHIIPLNNKYVCGLHVLENLQYLSASENSQKRNKFDGTVDNNGWRKVCQEECSVT